MSEFIIAIDSNEGRKNGKAYKFEDYKLNPPPVKIKLETGDYSLVGYTQDVTVERKAKLDFYQSIGVDSKRFMRELVRMQTFKRRIIVVESDYKSVLKGALGPNETYNPDTKYFLQGRTGMKRESVKARIAEIFYKYDVPILFGGDRVHCEEFTMRYLRKFYIHSEAGNL